MAVTQYIGARYVPIFADPSEWSSAKSYDALTIVTHEGNSYTSKQFVPQGIDIDNEEFWALTGNYNAQVEQYRIETSEAASMAQDASILGQNALDAVGDLSDEMTAFESRSEIEFNRLAKNDLSLSETLSLSNGYCTDRFIIGNGDSYPYFGYSSVQSSLYFKREDVKYLAMLTGNPTLHLLIINSDTYTLISDTTLGEMHGNNLSISGNLAITENHFNNELVVVNIASLLAPTIVGSFYVPNAGAKTIIGCSFVDETSKVAIAMGNYSGRAWNITDIRIYSDYTLANMESTIVLQNYNSNDHQSFQGLYVGNDVITLAHDNATEVCMFDMSGNRIGSFIPKPVYGLVKTGEIESFFNYDGDWYFTTIYTTSTMRDAATNININYALIDTMCVIKLDRYNDAKNPVLYDTLTNTGYERIHQYDFESYSNHIELKRLLIGIITGGATLNVLFASDAFNFYISNQITKNPVIVLHNYPHCQILNNVSLTYLVWEDIQLGGIKMEQGELNFANTSNKTISVAKMLPISATDTRFFQISYSVLNFYNIFNNISNLPASYTYIIFGLTSIINAYPKTAPIQSSYASCMTSW